MYGILFCNEHVQLVECIDFQMLKLCLYSVQLTWYNSEEGLISLFLPIRSLQSSFVNTSVCLIVVIQIPICKTSVFYTSYSNFR